MDKIKKHAYEDGSQEWKRYYIKCNICNKRMSKGENIIYLEKNWCVDCLSENINFVEDMKIEFKKIFTNKENKGDKICQIKKNEIFSIQSLEQ